MEDQFNTPRLLLRSFQESDSVALYKFQSDTDSMRYTFSTTDRTESQHFFRTHANQLTSIGYAPWTICLRDSQQIIGWGGLLQDPFDSGHGPEIAYFLGREYWGQGYATELVKFALAYGFREFELPWIGAFVRKDNGGSNRVLEKNGFEWVEFNEELQRNYFRKLR